MGPQVHGQDPLTASMLAAVPLIDQKQLLGMLRMDLLKFPRPPTPMQGIEQTLIRVTVALPAPQVSGCIR